MSIINVRRDNAIVWIGLNRPDKHNALNREMVDQLDSALKEASLEPSILIVHSTTPGIFMAGADLTELRERNADAALLAINAGLFERLEAHRWPTIALVDGPALGGGCELSLACDFRLASKRAIFGQPELSLGIIAGAGANWRLSQIAGLSITRKMLYAGEQVDALGALAIGLVDEIVDDVFVRGEVLGRSIAERSWRALELTKLSLRSHRASTTHIDLVAQALLFDGPDKFDRITAFLDRKSH